MNTIVTINKSDIKIIEKQLGRKPQGLRKVVSRCPFGYPEVIEAEPFLEGGKPFPTLYWLTCPVKVKAVSRLEGGGWSDKLRERLAHEDSLSELFFAAQEDYKRRRRLGAENADHPIFETGVGGVRDLEAVKCLHAHYAHYLASRTNPIGDIVNNAIKDIKCKERCG